MKLNLKKMSRWKLWTLFITGSIVFYIFGIGGNFGLSGNQADVMDEAKSPDAVVSDNMQGLDKPNNSQRDTMEFPSTEPSSSPSPAAAGNDPQPMSSPPITSESASPAADEKSSIPAVYQGKLASVQNGCMNQANSLVAELSAEVKAGQESKDGLSVSDLQSKYLPKIEAAERDCDKQFQDLIVSAEKEYQENGLSLKDIEVWKGQYEASKREAQKQAISTLMNSLSK